METAAFRQVGARFMNKVFFRYIAKSFWGPFFFGLGAFALLLLFGTLFDKMNLFLKSSSTIGTFVAYLLYQLPYFAVKMMPIATLLAVLFALSGMMACGEWKAGMAGGWKQFDMVLPLVACAAGAGVLQFCMQETVSPWCYMRAEYLFQGKIWGRADWKRMARRDISFTSPPDVFVTAHMFYGEKGRMESVLVDTYKDGKIESEINAALGKWDPSARSWKFFNGVLIQYGAGPEGRPNTTAFETHSGGLRSPPDSVILERLVPDGVNIASILGRIRRLERVNALGIALHGYRRRR